MQLVNNIQASNSQTSDIELELLVLTPKPSKQDGFTLIELLVVLTIGMILTSLLGGIGVDMVQKTQRQRDVNQVKSQIQQASYQAYLCGCGTTLNLEEHSIQLVTEGASFPVVELPQISLSPQSIEFQATGLPSESSITYWVAQNEESEQVNRDESVRTLDIMSVIESQ